MYFLKFMFPQQGREDLHLLMSDNPTHYTELWHILVFLHPETSWFRLLFFILQRYTLQFLPRTIRVSSENIAFDQSLTTFQCHWDLQKALRFGLFLFEIVDFFHNSPMIVIFMQYSMNCTCRKFLRTILIKSRCKFFSTSICPVNKETSQSRFHRN